MRQVQFCKHKMTPSLTINSECFMFASARLVLVGLPIATALAACGGSGVSPSYLSGQVVKGPVNSADVCVYAVTNAIKASTPLVPCVKSDPTGNYAFAAISGYAGDVIVEATNGTYKNEATGATTTLASTLRTVVPVTTGSVVGMVTPLTAIAFDKSTALTSAAFAIAAGNVAAQAGLSGTNILNTAPTFGTNGTTATNAYAAALGAFAQYQASAGSTLAQALASWNTPTNQAAFQTALSTYASSAQVLAANLPSNFNLSATGAALSFAIASPASTAGATSGTTTPGSTTTSTTPPASTVTSSGSTSTSSTLTATGAITSFVPILGLGVGTASVTTFSFTSGDGKSIAVIQDLGTATSTQGVTLQQSNGNTWNFKCNGATACAAAFTVSVGTKTLTFNNLTLSPVGNAVGTVTLNGSMTYI
jgi:hypothetical protein